MVRFPKTVLLSSKIHVAVQTPYCTQHGLGSFHFARRYFGNRCFFLFLRLLRCFSSPGSLYIAMYSLCSDWSSSSQVSPFRNLRIDGYLLLPVAFRSLSRLSSALSAKASTLRSFTLNHTITLSYLQLRSVEVAGSWVINSCLHCLRLIDRSFYIEETHSSYSTSPGEIISFTPTFHKFKFISYIHEEYIWYASDVFWNLACS